MPLEDRLDTGVLALIGSEHRAIPLLPLVRIGAPKGPDGACYFYSRREGETARYVSYHQDENATDESAAPLEFLQRWNRDPSDRDPV